LNLAQKKKFRTNALYGELLMEESEMVSQNLPYYTTSLAKKELEVETWSQSTIFTLHQMNFGRVKVYMRAVEVSF
jgi:hypothetical protein